MNNQKIGFTASTLKYYAIAAMLIDHIAWCFVPFESVLGQIMHIIGRTTAPIMSYFIAEGFYYTSNVKKYIIRMGVFAVISYPAYLFMKGILYFDNGIKLESSGLMQQSVIYTFFISLLILSVKNRNVCSSRFCAVNNMLLIISLFAFALFGDWNIIIPAWVLVFYTYRGNFKKQAIAFTIVSIVLITVIYAFFLSPIEYLFQYSVLLALIPLSFYNGKRESLNCSQFLSKLNKWAFYVFYPLHMAILGLLEYFIT